MKFSYFLDTAQQVVPAPLLKARCAIAWYNEDALMYGRVLTSTGNRVTVTDGKFLTNETFTVNRDQVLAVYEGAQLAWKREAVPTAVLASLTEALASMPIKEVRDFNKDVPTKQVILDQVGPHELAELCGLAAAYSVLNRADQDNLETDDDLQTAMEAFLDSVSRQLSSVDVSELLEKAKTGKA